jgi:hypothetical protein
VTVLGWGRNFSPKGKMVGDAMFEKLNLVLIWELKPCAHSKKEY